MIGTLERLIDRIEQLEQEIDSFRAACASRTLDGYRGIPPGAEPIVHAIDIHKLSNGSVEVALDGGRRFKLPPQLAEVFLFIASGRKNPDHQDPLVGWRTRKEILDYLGGSSGRTYPQRFVNNLIHRLKDLLRAAGYSRNLIQTHRRRGVRLAYRQSPADEQAINR